MAKRYTWIVEKRSVSGSESHVWVVLDSAGNKVTSGEAPWRAVAVLAAAKVIHQLEKQNRTSTKC
jgi:hypothetical protein